MENKIYTYNGRNIEELSREELIEALKYATNEIHRQYREVGLISKDFMSLMTR